MSFPRAKIHRFNEETSCAPPPGRYDPKLDAKVKGAVLPTSKRFPEQLSSSSSLDNLDKSSSSQVVFRTPQLSRKGIPRTPSLKHLKDAKDFDTPGANVGGKLCKSDKKGSASSLTQEKRPISRADYQRLENELSCLAERYNNEINFKSLEITHLKDKLEEIKDKENQLILILEEKRQLQDSFDNLSVEMSQLKDSKVSLEEVITEKESIIMNLERMYSDLKNSYTAVCELNSVNSEIIKNISEESCKRFDELLQQLKLKEESLQLDFDNGIQELHVDTLSKLNMTFNDLKEKSQTMENETEKCIDVIKQLKRELDKKVKALSNAIEVADERCRLMFRELCAVEKQRDDLVTSDLEKKLHILEIQQVVEELKSDLEQSRNKCKRYEITQKTMNDTISALSTRLIESETEVERLNQVEVDLEAQRQALEEKSNHLLSDVSDLRAGMENLQKEIISDVTQMKVTLEGRVEYFKCEAVKQVQEFKNKLNAKQEAIDLLLNENESLRQILETKEQDESMHISKVKKYQEDIANLKKSRAQSEEEYEATIKEYRYKLSNMKEENQKEVHILERENINKAQNIVDLSMAIDNLKETIDDYSEQMSGLRQDKSNLVAELGKITDELDLLKNDNFLKIQIIDEISSTNSNLKASNSKLNEKINTLEEVKNKLIFEVGDINVEVSSLKNDIICKDKTIEELMLNNCILKETNKACETDIMNLRKQKDDLAENLSKVRNDLSVLKEDNASKDQKIETFSVTNDKLNKTIDEMERNIVELKADKKMLTIELENVNEEIITLRDNNINNCQAIEEYEKKINDLIKQNDELNCRLKSQIEKEISHIQDVRMLNDATAKIEQLESVITAKDEELEQLRERLQDVSVEEVEAEALRERLEVLRLQLVTVTEERDTADRELAELMGHQNTLQKIKHVNQLKQQYNELREEVDRITIENTILKKKLGETKDKENVLVECTPKPLKQKLRTKPPLSPNSSILRDRNH